MAALVDRSSQARYADLSRAINAAIGAIVAHDTARGGSAYEGVDIERLFSAVEMLADRWSQELAPFVSSWIAAASFTGKGSARFPALWSKNFMEALAEAGGRRHLSTSTRLENAFKDGVAALRPGDTSDEVFGSLRDFMFTHLQDLLRVDISKVDYLSPLLNATRPIRVATLNYDTTIEDLAWRAGASLTTGVSEWQPGATWTWDDSEIRLLKLHGSLTWELRPSQGMALPETEVLERTRRPDGTWPYPNMWVGGGAPGLIFGRRGKLRADGPFIPMLQELDRFLAESDTLVIIGYSLRDDHINTAIARWFNRADAHVVLVDPSLPEDGRRHSRSAHPGFRDRLMDAMHKTFAEDSQRPLREEHHILSLGAGEALALLLGQGPDIPASGAISDPAETA